jgi:hypothetical protein
MHTDTAPDTTPDPVPPRRLARRQFLGAAGAAGALALAGCTAALSEATTLDWTGELTEADTRERHQLFGDDVTFTVRQLEPAPAAGLQVRPVPFEAILHHREGLRMERLSLRLRAPPRDGSPFDADVYVRSPPNGWWPPLQVREDADGWTVVESHDLGADGGGGAPGDSNVAVPFAIVPTALHPVDHLVVELDATLSGPATVGWRRYHVSRLTTFPLVRGDGNR